MKKFIIVLLAIIWWGLLIVFRGYVSVSDADTKTTYTVLGGKEVETVNVTEETELETETDWNLIYEYKQ